MQLGKRIKSRAKQLRIGPTELAKRINTSKPNIYTIYKRNSMDVQLLMQLCEALEYNFFKDLAGLCDNTLAKGVSEQDKITYISTTEKLTEELIECKEKYTMLKQIYISKNGPII